MSTATTADSTKHRRIVGVERRQLTHELVERYIRGESIRGQRGPTRNTFRPPSAARRLLIKGYAGRCRQGGSAALRAAVGSGRAGHQRPPLVPDAPPMAEVHDVAAQAGTDPVETEPATTSPAITGGGDTAKYLYAVQCYALAALHQGHDADVLT